ncbi:MAG: DUF2752 domain-containing protein [Leptolyngbyaceae cyanobacterium RU_5_1]|nr:DUF2752 domain-containing protein [Leptolyngbyaceae cyanobacterium RU_5_1]
MLSCQLLSEKARRIRYGILGLGLTPLIGAFLLNRGIHLPLKRCLFQWFLGFPSPTCGLTRSLTALMRGDWQQSLIYHLFGPILFVICLTAVVQSGIELITGHSLSGFTGKSLTTFYRQLLQHHWFIAICLLLLLSYYLLRLYARYGAEDPPFSGEHFSTWQFFVAGAKAL